MGVRLAGWLKWSPLAMLPLLAAWWLDTGSLQRFLSENATATLKEAGIDWAKVNVSGRDASVMGEAPSQEAINAAVSAVSETFGIRRAVAEATVVAPPPPPPPPPAPNPLPEPTAVSITTNNALPEISGTWPEKLAKTLAVTLADRTFKLGADPELTTDGAGNWMLKPGAPMADGRYEVTAEASDGADQRAQTKSTGILLIDTVAPKPPSVNVILVSSPPKSISGTWAEGDAVSLKVSISGAIFTLGSSAMLGSDGKGNWQLSIPMALPEGSHDIEVETSDAAGNISGQNVKGAIIVDLTAPAAPTIDAYHGTTAPQNIGGHWAEGDAVSLKVIVDGVSYQLGASAELTSDGAGRWTLNLPKPLAPGRHDASVETADRAGNVSKADGPGAIIIDVVPTDPTVLPYSGNDPTPRISGTWDSERAKTLRIALGGKTYELGKDQALASSQAGSWVLQSQPLNDGIYDVSVVTSNDQVNVSQDRTTAEIIIDTLGPTPPAVEKHAGNSKSTEIRGTWASGDAKSLSVSVGGRTYSLGQSPALKAPQPGAWVLAPDPLSDGYYDVVVVSADRFGNESRDATVAEVIVDTKGPAAPTIDRYVGNNSIPSVTGTWPEDDAKTLTVGIGGKTYQLAPNSPLVTDGKGNWRLKPGKLADGYYDVVAIAADAFGNESRDASVAEVVIDTTPPSVPTVNPASSLPVTGTFASGDAKKLTVALAGRKYVWGIEKELSAQGDVWTLSPITALGPGIYDIAVETVDDFGNKSTDASTAELYIRESPPPPAMAAPTVTAATELVARPKITGTWSEGIAKSLRVTLAGESHLMGSDEALMSDGKGNWTFAVAKPLKDGTYDIVVETTDAAGNAKRDESENELIIDAAGPATPTVDLYSGELSPAAIAGHWAEGDAVSLSVSVAGTTATLGADPALRSDGNGRWTWSLAQTLDPGSYDVVVKTADARGRVSSDQTKFEILVRAIDQAKPVPEPAPIDCQSEFNTLLIVEVIRFAPDSADLNDASRATVRRLADIATSCPQKAIEIAGHTDSQGSSEYNQALSEQRAVAVLEAMIEAGIDRTRMIAKGYGEDRPLATNETEEGRTVNRRVEFTIIN